MQAWRLRSPVICCLSAWGPGDWLVELQRTKTWERRTGKKTGLSPSPRTEDWCSSSQAGRKQMGWVHFPSPFRSTQALKGLDGVHPCWEGSLLYWAHSFKCWSPSDAGTFRNNASPGHPLASSTHKMNHYNCCGSIYPSSPINLQYTSTSWLRSLL